MTSSTQAVPTPTESFVPDAPIQFDIMTPVDENGSVITNLAGPPKLVLLFLL